MVLAMGGGVLVLAVVLVLVLTKKDAPPPKKPPALGPAPALAPGDAGPPREEPPKPLTPTERAEVDRVFAEASKEIEAMRKFIREGNELKRGEDESGANDKYVESKQRYMAALRTVNEVMEDEARFPMKRQEAFLSDRLREMGGWAKEIAEVGKVHAR